MDAPREAYKSGTGSSAGANAARPWRMGTGQYNSPVEQYERSISDSGSPHTIAVYDARASSASSSNISAAPPYTRDASHAILALCSR